MDKNETFPQENRSLIGGAAFPSEMSSFRVATAIPDELNRPRLNRPAASRYLATVHGITVATSTLAKLACVGGGPSFQKSGRIPLYPVELLDRWARERLGVVRRSTSDQGALR